MNLLRWLVIFLWAISGRQHPSDSAFIGQEMHIPSKDILLEHWALRSKIRQSSAHSLCPLLPQPGFDCLHPKWARKHRPTRCVYRSSQCEPILYSKVSCQEFNHESCLLGLQVAVFQPSKCQHMGRPRREFIFPDSESLNHWVQSFHS